jgi:hypothetical protein
LESNGGRTQAWWGTGGPTWTDSGFSGRAMETHVPDDVRELDHYSGTRSCHRVDFSRPVERGLSALGDPRRRDRRPCQLGMLWFIPRVAGDQKERVEQFRSRSVLRYRIFVPKFFILGVMSGALSAISNDRFLVLAYTIGVIVFCGAPYIILPIVARKFRKRST